MRLFLVIVLLAFFISLCAVKVKAGGLLVSPAELEFSIFSEREVVVFNPTEDESVVSFSVSEGSPAIGFSQRSFDLKAGERRSVFLKLRNVLSFGKGEVLILSRPKAQSAVTAETGVRLMFRYEPFERFVFLRFWREGLIVLLLGVSVWYARFKKNPS